MLAAIGTAALGVVAGFVVGGSALYLGPKAFGFGFAGGVAAAAGLLHLASKYVVVQ